MSDLNKLADGLEDDCVSMYHESLVACGKCRLCRSAAALRLAEEQHAAALALRVRCDSLQMRLDQIEANE